MWSDHDVFLSFLISFHGYEFYQNYYHSIMYKLYWLCTGYDNDYWIMYFIGIMDNYGRIMVKLWALSTIIDDYEVFFKKTHNKDIIEP